MTTIASVRTPDAAFADLPGFPWAPHYLDTLPSLGGLRMHYLDEGPRDAPITWLCLHGNPSWSYLYRKMIPAFLAAGHRVLAPDLPGFGKSDKPTDPAQHQFSWHRQVLREWIDAIDPRNVNLVVQDWGGLLGLTLPMLAPERYRGLLVMNTMLATGEAPLSDGFLRWRQMCRERPDFSISRLMARGFAALSDAEAHAYDAPFPSLDYRAATRAFPERVPEHPGDDGAEVSREAAAFWSSRWSGATMMAIGASDPVFTPAHMATLAAAIRGCPAPMSIAEGGHFVQEHGEAIALEALRVLG